MTQATRSLTSTSTIASLLTASANTSLKWQLPNWSVAASASGSEASFSQMLASAGRSRQDVAQRSTLDDSDSSRRAIRSGASESFSSDDRSANASVAENRRSSRQEPETPLAASRQSDPEPIRDDPTIEPDRHTAGNQAISDPQPSDSSDPAAEPSDDWSSSSSSAIAQDQASEESSTASAGDPSSSDSDQPATGDHPTQADLTQEARFIAQAAIQQMMSTVTLESLMSQTIASTGMSAGQPTAQAGSESKTAASGASAQSPAKAASQTLPLMLVPSESDSASNPQTQNNASGLPMSQEGTLAPDHGAKPDAKMEIKADFAQKLSEHRPIESLLSMAGEKKSASLATGSASASPASNGSASQLPESADQSNIAQVARGLQNAFKQGGGSVTLRLTPAELGSIKVQLAVQDGVVQAKFTAESQAAGDLLTHQMDQLRQALQKQGLHVDRLEVQIPANPPAQASNLPEHSPEDSSNSTAWADDGRSRGQMQDSTRQQQRRHEQADSTQPATVFSDLLNTTA